MRKNRLWFQFTLIGILAVAVLGSTLTVLTRNNSAFVSPIADAHRIISQRFISETDQQMLQAAAINGMLDVLDDPYTFYVPPAETDEFDKQIIGEYVGIGVAVDMIDGWLTIVTPLDGSPSIAAGVRAGDRIVEIEGVSTADKTPDECVEQLMGEVGEPVNITIERGGERFPVTITRRKIITQTVRGFHRAEDEQWQHLIDTKRRIGYIRVSQFNPTTADEFEHALDRLEASQPGRLGGLILDMRGNPGGLMSTSVAMADRFLESGIIVSTRGRSFPTESAEAHVDDTLTDFPILVMVDGQSASASEIFAGALADHNRAIILGERSFGKASIQQVYTLRRSNAQLKVTEGRYALPSGESPHREPGSTAWGVDPSPGFYVPMSADEWLAAMLVQQTQEIIGGESDTIDWLDTQAILDALGDRQISAAVDAMQKRIDLDRWEPVGQDPPSGEQLVAENLESLHERREAPWRDIANIDQSLREIAETGVSSPEPPDLWPDDTEISGGHVEVFDAQGNSVARLSVTDSDLERWLQASGLELSQQDEGGDG